MWGFVHPGECEAPVLSVPIFLGLPKTLHGASKESNPLNPTPRDKCSQLLSRWFCQRPVLGVRQPLRGRPGSCSPSQDLCPVLHTSEAQNKLLDLSTAFKLNH